MNAKILNHFELGNIVRLLKKGGKKIVIVNGSFDIMHSGHIKFLQKAKQFGDILIVLVNSDKSIQKYKGPNRPIMEESERANVIAAIAYVDYVTIFDEIQPKILISKLKPDIYCNGSDWGKYCVEREVVEEGGGKVVIINRKKSDTTTSSIINKILLIYSKPQVKAIFIDRDGTINDDKGGYTHKIEDYVYLPGVIDALQQLSKTKFKIIIITNQSGIGRGYYSKRAYDKLMKFVISDLRKKKIRIDGVYYCPHPPQAGCDCRKPKIGMLLQAVSDFGISLNDSWLIGDDDKDIIMGREANVKTIKIGEINKKLYIRPNYSVKNLKAAAKIILASDK